MRILTPLRASLPVRIGITLTVMIAVVLPIECGAEPDSQRELLVTAAREAVKEGQYEQAEQGMRRVLDQTTASYTPGQRSVDLQNLGLILYSQARFQEAVTFYFQALPLTESCWGADSLAVADNLYGVVKCLRRARIYGEAEPHMFRILDIRTRQLGKSHKSVGNALLDLAVNYDRQEKYAEAEVLYAKALLIKENQWGKDSCDNVPYLEQYASILRKLNRTDAAALVDSRIEILRHNPSTPEPRNYDDKSGWLWWPAATMH